jgi:hypothetical protein
MGWRWVDILVVLAIIVLSVVVVAAVPCVGHLNYERWWDREYPKER